MTRSRIPEGPKGTMMLGNVVDFARDPLGFLTRCGEHGDIVRLKLEHSRDTFLITDPDDIETVLMNREGKFSKGYQGDPILHLVLGNGLVTSEGEFWRKQRRLAQPVFQPRHIAGYADTMTAYSERMVRSWEADETRDIHEDMMHLTMNIAVKTLFDLDLDEGESREAGHALNVVLKEYNAQMTSVYKQLLRMLGLGKLVPPVTPRLRRAVEQLDKVVYAIIRERRQHPGDRHDLLSALIAACGQAEDDAMTDRQLRDEVITLFLAGHETTANTLTWAAHLLSRHPQVDEKLGAEVREVLGDRSPTFEDLPRLSYTEKVIKETLRVYPTVWWISRRADEEVELGEYTIPAGSEVVMSQWVMHRSPRYFDDPLAFKPERWDEENPAPSKFVYFPFGGGPRICIGNHFAMMEAVLALAVMARRFCFEPVPDHPVIPEPSVTLRPRQGVRVVIRKRRANTGI